MIAFLTQDKGGGNGRPQSAEAQRPVGGAAFTWVAAASIGGPLALAALNVPGIVAGASASAGLAVVATAVVFAFPLAIWLRYARDVSGSGGLYSFVEAAAARPLRCCTSVPGCRCSSEGSWHGRLGLSAEGC